MPIVVSIPGLGEVEFPDSMSLEDISRESQNLYDQYNTPQRKVADSLALKDNRAPNLNAANAAGAKKVELGFGGKLMMPDLTENSELTTSGPVINAWNNLTDVSKEITPEKWQAAVDMLKSFGLHAQSMTDSGQDFGKLANEIAERPTPAPGTAAQVLSGLHKASVGAVTGMATPMGVATLTSPVGIGGRLASLGFTVDMLSHMPDQVEAFKQATAKGDLEGQVESLAGIILTGAFAWAAGKHAATSEKVRLSKELAREIIRAEQEAPSRQWLQQPIEARAPGLEQSPVEGKFYTGPWITKETPEPTPIQLEPEVIRQAQAPSSSETAIPVSTVNSPIDELIRISREHRSRLTRQADSGLEEPVTPEGITPVDEAIVTGRLTRGLDRDLETAQEPGGTTPVDELNYRSKLTKWRKENNRTAEPPHSQEWNLPPGMSYGDLNVIVHHGTQENIKETYESLVKLNPSLATISFPERYDGPFSPERDVVGGVASKFKLDNIKYFVEDLRGSGVNSKVEREKTAGVQHFIRPVEKPPVATELQRLETLEELGALTDAQKSRLNELRNPKPVAIVEAPPADKPAPETPKPLEVPGDNELIDLSTIDDKEVKTLDPDKFKTGIKVMFDPGKANKGAAVREPEQREVMVGLSPKGANRGKLVIQTKGGKTTRTIWSGDRDELIKEGVITLVGDGTKNARYTVDWDKLFSSPSLVRAKTPDLQGYKFQHEKMERSLGAEMEDIVAESVKINPFLGAITRYLSEGGLVTKAKIEQVASARSGNKIYAGKTSKQLAVQVSGAIDRIIESRMDELAAKASESTLTTSEKNEAMALAQIRAKLEEDEPEFSPDDAALAAAKIASFKEFDFNSKDDLIDNDKVVPLDKDRVTEEGEKPSTTDIGVSDRRSDIESTLGVIHDKDPDLYEAMAAADLKNEKHWTDIADRLEKITGSKAEAELLAEEIRYMREHDNAVLSPGFQKIDDYQIDITRELVKPNPFGLTVAKDGTVPFENLMAKIEKSSQISKGELDALKEAGVFTKEVDHNGRVNIAGLLDTIRSFAPVVVSDITHASGNEKFDPSYIEAMRLRHEWFDNLDPGKMYEYMQAEEKAFLDETIEPPNMLAGALRRAGWAEDEIEKASRYFNAKADYEFSQQYRNEPRWEHVGPKFEMPGYVEIAAVAPRLIKNGKSKMRDSHGFPPNTIAWVRAYVETLPSGEKVLRIIELQSDWAQNIRDRSKNPRLAKYGWIDDDPLLRYYESIILKAAIRYARETGINKIAIDDADTVMLTEGHDLHADYPIGDSSYTKKSFIKQEAGIKLHYDQTIPNTMKKLSGDNFPFRAEFGEHTNTRNRDDLVIMNPNGTPKRNSTGLVFDVSRVDVSKPARLYRSSVYSPKAREEYIDEPISSGKFARGKDQIAALVQDRALPLDPVMRRVTMALVDRLPDKYLRDLNFNLTTDGGVNGEFIPLMKLARVAFDGNDPLAATHEISHYLATVLPESDRARISALRKAEIDRLRSVPEAAEFIQWIGSGSETSLDYLSYRKGRLSQDKYYHLINDDEYFAHNASHAVKRLPEEMKGLVAKAREIVRAVITAIKEWVGNKDAYFDQIIRRFEKGEFDVDSNGGMLFERNNSGAPRSLPPIKGLNELRRYERVDRGEQERRLINRLTIDQNGPLVRTGIEAFRALPRNVRSQLPEFAGRAAAYLRASREPSDVQSSSIRHLAFVSNHLDMVQSAKRLGRELDMLASKIKSQAKTMERASESEAKSKALAVQAKELISDYKNYLLSELRKAKDDGIADGLMRTIKELDKMQGSSVSLERAVEHAASLLSMEELTNPALTHTELINIIKERAAKAAGVSNWHEAHIPALDGRPGISKEEFRRAISIMQSRQKLVQDIIEYKELSNDDYWKSIKSYEESFDQEATEFTDVRKFAAKLNQINSAKDRARKIYLRYKRKFDSDIQKLDDLIAAEKFLHENVINNPEVKAALEEAGQQGFMTVDLAGDHSGQEILKRTYRNPLNREESVDIVDGFSREDYLKNNEKFNKVADWLEKALESESLDPLDAAWARTELDRIYSEELGQFDPESEMYLGRTEFDPKYGKRLPGVMNVPNYLSNLMGNSLQRIMERIGGRAAVQELAIIQARSEAKIRVSEVRRDQTPLLQKAIGNALKVRNMDYEVWRREIANPIMSSFNSLGAKPIAAGDVTRFGHRVNGADMAAMREMKRMFDEMTDAGKVQNLHTARLHPIAIDDVMSGVKVRRPAQGHNDMIVPRHFDQEKDAFVNQWGQVRSGRPVKEAAAELAELVDSGREFEDLVLGHIYATQRYPDYVHTTRFTRGYRDIYRSMHSGEAPKSLDQVVDRVFDSQEGLDVPNQLTKPEIKQRIIEELDGVVRAISDEAGREHPVDAPDNHLTIVSHNNFMTKPRGRMVAPDAFYKYTLYTRHDINWLTRQVMEVHNKRAIDGLLAIRQSLTEWIAKFEGSNRAEHPNPQKETRARQMSGQDWLNYNEAKQMLNQVNRVLGQFTNKAFAIIVDPKAGGVASRAWSLAIQNLLQSITVLKNNLLGANQNLWRFEALWRGDGNWHGLPKWLVKFGPIAKNAAYYPVRDLVAYPLSYVSHKKAVEKLGPDVVKSITDNPLLAQQYQHVVGAEVMRRAVLRQRALDLGILQKYGIGRQISKYLENMTHGGEIDFPIQTTKEKALGAVESAIGIISETGFPPLLMLPKATVSKLEGIINFSAMRHAQRILDEVEMNMHEAIVNRRNTGRADNITDEELLGDPTGDASFMRNMFNRAGINIDRLVQRLQNHPEGELLNQAEWNSFVLEVMKEMNRPTADNRLQYSNRFAKLMSTLMGYGTWANERAAHMFSGDSRVGADFNTIYRTAFYLGTLAAVGTLLSTPIQRVAKRFFYGEEDLTGHFQADNTAVQNATVLMQQTASFWPLAGQLVSQFYDVSQGGGKPINLLPFSAAQSILQTGREIAQTGNVLLPTMRFIKQWAPNSKIVLNRLPNLSGGIEVNNATRILRSTADGSIEVRAPKIGGIKYTPVSTQLQLAVNELAKEDPNWDAIDKLRADAVKYYVKHGSSESDAKNRFDRGVLARLPQNTVFGRPLTEGEWNRTLARMTPIQRTQVGNVEKAFARYATHVGMRAPQPYRSEKPKMVKTGRQPRIRRARTIRTNRRLTRPA